MPSSHALLSASSAKRWIACPPSARIAAEFPDRESEAAEAGTKAHQEAEEYFRYNLTPTDPFVWQYILYIKSQAAMMEDCKMLIEERVSYGHIAEKGFGTADCIIYNKDILHIIDFKYGQGVLVEAGDNPQMALYALGAIRQLKIIPNSIKMTIFQPRMGNLSTWTVSRSELNRFGERISKAAAAAWHGEGVLAAGEHCTFCPYKNICTEFKSYFTDQYLVTYLGG